MHCEIVASSDSPDPISCAYAAWLQGLQPREVFVAAAMEVWQNLEHACQTRTTLDPQPLVETFAAAAEIVDRQIPGEIVPRFGGLLEVVEQLLEGNGTAALHAVKDWLLAEDRETFDRVVAGRNAVLLDAPLPGLDTDSMLNQVDAPRPERWAARVRAPAS